MLTIALGAVGPIALMSFGLLMNGLANIIKLFAHLKSSFNRTGASTKILGNQTDYLTKEQLEASAVAASLDQVHQRLRQTFTSETAAVNALALAYRNAIAAQVGFTGPIGKGKMPQSKKYSTGVTSIPGPKGAGDIVQLWHLLERQLFQQDPHKIQQTNHLLNTWLQEERYQDLKKVQLKL